MRILLTGSSGFIGSRLRDALRAAGHELVCAGRRPDGSGCAFVAADFAAPPPRWASLLDGVEVVVNAVGIFRERPGASFAALHVDGPLALFEACAAAGVRRVVQLSALGADDGANTAYHRSKAEADRRLLALPLDATVVQPSLVFGAEGPSAALFLSLAALPLLPLPAGGHQPLQPVHVDDAVAAIVALVQAPPGRWRGRRVALVGPRALTLANYLQRLRAGLGLRPAATLALPAAAVTAAAGWGSRFGGGLFDRDAWRMLQRGNTAAAADTAALLGAPPRPVEAFIAPGLAPALRARAELAWTLPLLRLSLAGVWLVTAWVSLFVYPRDASLELLARAGVPAALQGAALLGAAGLDAIFGVLTLAPWRRGARRWLWLAQAALIAGYTLVISVALPEFWAHPYGPLTKNLPLLALLALLWARDRPPPR
ncbi:short chain dehydrogenase [Rubrivivax gelatinosus]|nr:short chain dehydrogenase [Rubrivivax gelatinosus]